MEDFLDRLISVGVDEGHKWHYHKATICQIIGLSPIEAKYVRTCLTKIYKIGEKASAL